MTTILTPEEIFLPTTRRPNKVLPRPVAAPMPRAYVIGKPWLSVQGWTPEDHYAGPVPDPSAATPAWARNAMARTENAIAPSSTEREFRSGPPTNFTPCERRSMVAVGMNRTLPVNPTFQGSFDTQELGKALAIGGISALATYFLARRLLRSR